jgi:RNA polymerase sigma-70 factor, ECF subfamily
VLFLSQNRTRRTKKGASISDSEGEIDSDAAIRGLLERARAGDQAALGELLENYRGHLRFLAQNLLDDRAAPRIDASDLVQQTCLSVHKQIAEFDGKDVAQFAAWLRQIHERNVRNAVRDQLHTGKRDIAREERLADRDVHATGQATPSQYVVRNEESERLARAIAQLPEDEQEALRRRYLEGQSLAEVGAAMGLTKDGLVWLMKRAMKNVKRFLGDEPK